MSVFSRSVVAAAVGGALVLLSGCAQRVETPVRPDKVSQSDRSIIQSYIVDSMKDPDSAQLRAIRSYSVADGGRAICGEVNGRNSFGGYVGYQPFYVLAKGQRIVESYVPRASTETAMVLLAQGACAKAASGSLDIPQI